MLEIVKASKALGISACQLGESVNIIVINRPQIDPSKYGKPLVAINPILKRHPHKPRRSTREGCLSIPTFFERVKRYEWIEWDYIDYSDGLTINSTLLDLEAAVVQHEIDHLNGILFIDHIDSISRSIFDRNWEKILQDILQEANNDQEAA